MAYFALLNPKNSAVDPVAQEKEEKENRAAGQPRKERKALLGSRGRIGQPGAAQKRKEKENRAAGGSPVKKEKHYYIGQPGAAQKMEEQENRAAGGIHRKARKG